MPVPESVSVTVALRSRLPVTPVDHRPRFCRSSGKKLFAAATVVKVLSRMAVPWRNNSKVSLMKPLPATVPLASPRSRLPVFGRVAVATVHSTELVSVCTPVASGGTVAPSVAAPRVTVEAASNTVPTLVPRPLNVARPPTSA